MSMAFNPTSALASHTRPARSRRVDGAAAFTQGSLALTYAMPNGLPTQPRADLSLVPAPDIDAPPPADAWASTFLQAVIEAVANDRPVSQLARWTSSRVYADLDARRKRVAEQLGNGRSLRATRHQVASVRVCAIAGDIAEVSSRVVTGRRSRALAARLEYVHERWMCTALVFG
jgi:hypothetical protein